MRSTDKKLLRERLEKDGLWKEAIVFRDTLGKSGVDADVRWLRMAQNFYPDDWGKLGEVIPPKRAGDADLPDPGKKMMLASKRALQSGPDWNGLMAMAPAARVPPVEALEWAIVNWAQGEIIDPPSKMAVSLLRMNWNNSRPMQDMYMKLTAGDGESQRDEATQNKRVTGLCTRLLDECQHALPEGAQDAQAES